MTNLVKRFANDESGATAIEYALIAAIMGVGLVSAFKGMRGEASNVLTDTGAELAAGAS